MEHVSAWELLWCIVDPRLCRPRGGLSGGNTKDHLAADDTSPVTHLSEFFLACVGISLVHVACGSAVTQEVSAAGDKGTSCDVYITRDVERQAIEGQDAGGTSDTL